MGTLEKMEEMNWKNKTVNLGTLKEGQVKKFKFIPLKQLDVVKVSPGCGSCTKAKFKQGVIDVIFTAENIPRHIAILQPYQLVRKTIVVTYADGNQEVLTFTAKILKR